MLLPAAVNYPCQPSRIKHRSCRPVHSLTRAVLPAAPHQLQNKWLVVSPDVVLGFAWPPRHRHPPRHQFQQVLLGQAGMGGHRAWGTDPPWKAPGPAGKASGSWGRTGSSTVRLLLPRNGPPARSHVQAMVCVLLLRQG